MSSDHNTALSPDAFSGPHAWQTKPWAKLVRRTLRQREYIRWSETYCKPLKVQGLENLEKLDGPAIFVPNHQSHMDTPVIMAGLPQHLQNNIYFGAAADRWFVKGKKKLILQPWYQSLALGTFPIVRGGGSQALDYARELLRKNVNICIFPEGTRALGSELGRFRHGVSILALSENVPLVPVVLKGLREMRPKGAQEITPGLVSISFLEPIRLIEGTEVADATEQLWRTMNGEFARPISFPARVEPTKIDRAA
jgi:1-acyl-sn-glycerol-3-phosphate acyltransferase